MIIVVGAVASVDTINYVRVHQIASLSRWDLVAKWIGFLIVGLTIFIGPMLCLFWQLFESRRNGEQKAADLGREYIRFLNDIPDAVNLNPDKKIVYIQEKIENLTYMYLHYYNVSTMKLWPMDLKSTAEMTAIVVGPLVLLIPEFRDFYNNIGIVGK